MSEKVKQSSFERTDLNAFAERTNAYIPGFIDGTSNVKIPADQFAAPTPQVQSDWNQSDDSAVDFIKNKPTIPTAQVQSDWEQDNSTAVDFIKNKPSIPAAQIQSDWNQSDNSAVDFIKNKPTIPTAQVQADWNQSDNTAADFIKNKPVNPGQQQADWNQTDTSAVDFIKNKPTINGVTQYLSWDGESNLFSTIEAIIAAGNVPVVRYQNYDWLCVDSTNDNRFVFWAELGEGSTYGFLQFFAGTSPILRFSNFVLSDGLSTAMANSKTVPIIMYPPTSSDVNETKKNRAAICRLDKNHSDDGVHTDNCCEFLIHLNTGATANGNANSSLSLHVLVNALEDGGPYHVDMRVTGNNNWDLTNARPTIALADTGSGNDGVIMFFGLFNSADTGWVDFEQTTMTVVVMNPVPVLLGNTDKVNSLSGLTIHRLSPDNIPSVSYGSPYECLCIDSNGALEWESRMRGVLTEAYGQGGTTSSEIRNLRINTNAGAAGMVRVTPVGGSVQIIGRLAPEFGNNDGNKILAVDANAEDLVWVAPPSIPTLPQINFIQHNQDVTLRTGQYLSPERYNLNCYIPARTNFYGSITIDSIYTNDPTVMYNFTLYVPGNDMRCIFGTYPSMPQCGHNINFVVSNTGNTQYQLYFELTGTFVSQEIEVRVRGITVSM